MNHANKGGRVLKTSILCALGGIALILIGNFEKFTTTQTATTQHNQPCFFVQPNRLNVRNAPNLEAKIISQLQQNFKICTYFNTHNGFLQTEKGWIATKYLSLEPFSPKQLGDFTLASTQIATRTLNLASDSANKESLYAKPQNKSKFQLTSVPKNSTPDSLLESNNLNPIAQARMEMENQNYTRAKNLALRANSENPKNLESWEIFVKSVYLEGKPQEAILILQNFLRQNYDENLTNLLRLMQQGQKI